MSAIFPNVCQWLQQEQIMFEFVFDQPQQNPFNCFQHKQKNNVKHLTKIYHKIRTIFLLKGRQGFKKKR